MFLCLIVVLIHLLSKPLSETLDAPLHLFYMPLARLCTFVVQGFIFLSSMKLFLNGRRSSYGQFLKKRVKTVVIPYIFAVVIYYIYFVYVLKWLEFGWLDLAGYLVRGDIAAQFYFVIAIMQFYLLYPLWLRIADSVKPLPAILVSAAVTLLMLYSPFIEDKLTGGWSFWYYDRLFPTYMIYWTGGMFAGIYYDKFLRFVKRYKWIFFAAAAVTAAADVLALFMRERGIITALHVDVIHAAYCSLMILSCFAAATLIKSAAEWSWVKKLDKSSYYIYLVHVLLIFIFDNHFGSLAIRSTTLLFLVRCVIIYAAVFAIAYGNLKHKNKSKEV